MNQARHSQSRLHKQFVLQQKAWESNADKTTFQFWKAGWRKQNPWANAWCFKPINDTFWILWSCVKNVDPIIWKQCPITTIPNQWDNEVNIRTMSFWKLASKIWQMNVCNSKGQFTYIYIYISSSSNVRRRNLSTITQCNSNTQTSPAHVNRLEIFVC